jgi:hypothetical protein
LEIYFENPDFGYYFLRLSSERLMQNVARLEAIVEQNKAKPTQVVAAFTPEDSQGGEAFRPAGPAGGEARA